VSNNLHNHWESVYQQKAADTVSWYRPHLERSLDFIGRAQLVPDDPLIDVGGGTSTLVDDLLDRGHRDVTVLDLSEAALGQARLRLGARADQVRWLQADVTRFTFDVDAYGFWHDRAVFHFLTDAEARGRYASAVRRALRPGGHLLVATFSLDGPARCSGLPVMRHSAETLKAEFENGFTWIDSAEERHVTPSAANQSFVYGYFQRNSKSGI